MTKKRPFKKKKKIEKSMRRETAQLIDAMASRSFVSSDEKFT
jgi:hypothetical protein